MRLSWFFQLSLPQIERVAEHVAGVPTPSALLAFPVDGRVVVVLVVVAVVAFVLVLVLVFVFVFVFEAVKVDFALRRERLDERCLLANGTLIITQVVRIAVRFVFNYIVRLLHASTARFAATVRIFGRRVCTLVLVVHVYVL